MNNIYVFVKIKSQNIFLRNIYEMNIDIKDIQYAKDGLYFSISKDDYNKIKKYYDIKVIKEYSKKNILLFFKKNIIIIVSIIIGIIFFEILSKVIVEIEYKNNDYSKLYELNNRFEELGIKRLAFKKSYKEIEKIKEKIMIEFNDSIEWIEIKNIGMKYQIFIEERKTKIIEEKKEYCDIYATQDGIITKIISTSGENLVSENDSVKKGDLLISGNITYNNEIKNITCASGIVYAEVWYSMHLSVPKNYEVKKYTNKKRYNILLENGNKDYKIFKSRFKNYDTTNHQIISLLGKKIILLEEQEYIMNTLKYTEEEYTKKIDDMIINSINLNLNDKEKILYKNILKKEEFDSTIEIDIFVTVEKIISSK